MPRTSWICGSVWSAKFFGEPPPRMKMADLPPFLICLGMNDAAFGGEHDRSGFVDVQIRIQNQLSALQFFGGDVHADRRIAGR